MLLRQDFDLLSVLDNQFLDGDLGALNLPGDPFLNLGRAGVRVLVVEIR